MKYRTVAIVALLASSLTACTWVSLSSDAQNVMVLPRDRVAHCKKIGKTDVSVDSKVGFVSRYPSDVEQDLKTLARNTAAQQGGDTVSPLSPVKNGNQTFGIYKCLGSGQAGGGRGTGTGGDQGTGQTQPVGD
ncbi:MAG TPA: DUF4156 domain-containing protein [Gammaproteobacteria bacterium]|nr:DUF4156 domain-containing protein [Gammaproteobacteria bacterium]